LERSCNIKSIKVIVACGSGVATSTVIASKLKELLQENNINAQIVQCTLHEVEANAEGASLVLSSMPNLRVEGIPVVLAFPYITGIGVEALNQKILEILQT
jgi:PTS system galactitol-specific IIB component